MSRHQAMTRLLIDACRGRYTATVNGRALPPGCIPLYEFQTPELGGSAANTRMSELKRPEGDNNGKGIPIEKVVVKEARDGTKISRTICYKLAVDPSYIDLSGANCRIDKQLLQRAGLQVEEYIDDSCGPASRAVRIVKSNKFERHGQANLFASA